LALPDIVAITDIKLVPYVSFRFSPHSFFFDILPLHLQGNTKKLEDGTFSCQHGVDECTSDVFELCTEYKLSGNISSITTGDTSYAAFPFIQCMEINEGDPSKAPSCFSSTMANSGLAWSTVTACADNEASAVQNQAATASPSHDYVPWVLLDGNLVEHTDALLVSICKAYTGPAPPSCKRLYQKDASVCMNK
jgi:hypothetical protein